MSPEAHLTEEQKGRIWQSLRQEKKEALLTYIWRKHTPLLVDELYSVHYGGVELESILEVLGVRSTAFDSLTKRFPRKFENLILINNIITVCVDEDLLHDDDEKKFIGDYLDSHCVQGRPEEQVIEDLRGLIRLNRKNYVDLSLCLQRGEVRTLDEILDCASLNTFYHVVKILGTGATGTTYKVYSPQLDRHRALKVIPAEKVNTEEARLMATLEGRDLENLVQIYEASSDIVTVIGEKKYAIVMEYIDGKNLEERMKTKIEFEDAVSYSVQILNGINSLRNHGITHRDLNPRNIMVDNEGRIKIVDFGIATEELEAPQKDNRRYGGDSDIFSWALLTYELITGEHFIHPRDSGIGTTTHANKILGLKKELRTEEGDLKKEYQDQIRKNVPLVLQESILQALSISPPPVDHLLSDLVFKSTTWRNKAAEQDYSLRAEDYGTVVKTYRDPVLRAQSRALFEPINPNGIALDIGCGQGDASTCLQEEREAGGERILVPSVAEIHYLDVTMPMVSKGIERGNIDPRFVSVANAAERLPYPNNYFHYVITRYFIHDLDPEQKEFLFWDVKGILRPGGEFQIIDMVADGEETEQFYNKYHSRKTTGPPRPCWIPTEPEYQRLFAERGFVDVKTDRYTSHVNTKDWLRERQITPSRHEEINALFREELQRGGKVKEYFNLRESPQEGIDIDFPVLLICGVKPER